MVVVAVIWRDEIGREYREQLVGCEQAEQQAGDRGKGEVRGRAGDALSGTALCGSRGTGRG